MIYSALFLCFVGLAMGNIYLHNPRGSNNKYNEDNDNTQNQNRMFRSWNNRRGGHNVGKPMYYYMDSILEIEWTNSMSCGTGAEDKVDCDIILQYMCSPWLTDGNDQGTVTLDNWEEMTGGDYKYGFHEDPWFYEGCTKRERNKNLFLADQTLNGESARYTRQNPNGANYGFECAEEREYYPYWHPSPWRDIAIFTDDMSRCTTYQSESQNVAPKGYCKSDMSSNRRDTCPEGDWSEGMSHGISAPECLPTPFNRANHLGNTIGGYPNRYSWKIPYVNEMERERCALRIRYNVSTPMEVPRDLDYTSNEDLAQVITYFKERGVKSPIVNDPYQMWNGANISYAVDTRKYGGAVYQDRSHQFEIRERPVGVTNNIYNLNVRGKRGNIVETFPSTEYDFVPDVLTLVKHEYIHPQWTGSDNNPANAAGEGTDQTDRSNMVQMRNLNDNYPIDFGEQTLFSDEEAVRIGFAGMTYYASRCKSLAELSTSNQNDNEIEEDVFNCMKQNLGDPYFDGGLQAMRLPGTYYYMSTRNNNYSNRSQKGTIIVEDCNGDNCPQFEEVEEGSATRLTVVAVALANLLF